MKPALKERIFWWIAIPALAGVLALLAVLQYRWSGQVSDAARAQMQSNLHLALGGFRMDFTRELGAACLEVRAAVRESGSKGGEAFNQRFQRWQQSSGHPGLVSDVYLWKSTQRKSTQPQSPQGGPGAADQLLHVFPSSGKPVSVAWPDEFARVKDRLQEMSDIAAQAGGPRWLSGTRPGGPRSSGSRPNGERRNGPRSGQGQKMHDGREVNDGRGSAANQNPDRHSDQRRNQRAGRQGNRSPDNFFPWLVDQSLPLLVSVVRTPNPNGDGASGDGSAPVSLTWVIVRLNPNVLEKEVFPELTQRYFSASGGMDYRVAVTDGGAQEQHVLYSSSAGYRAASNQNSDAETDLFGPFFRRGGGAGPGPRMDMPVPPDTLGAHHPANGSSPAQHGQGKAQGQPQTQAQGQPGDHHDAMESMVRLEPFRFSADDGIWKVQVQHPLGSVDAAVGGLRRRNLMLSFGVLVLLAVTMAWW